jgi:hypothetical protein
LIHCFHILCFQCFDNLNVKNCPTCSSEIIETKLHLEILKHVKESNYDKSKKKLEKTINEIDLIEQKFETETKQRKIQEITIKVKLIKQQIEEKTNELSKILNDNKNKILNFFFTKRRIKSRIVITKKQVEEHENELNKQLDKNKFSLLNNIDKISKSLKKKFRELDLDIDDRLIKIKHNLKYNRLNLKELEDLNNEFQRKKSEIFIRNEDIFIQFYTNIEFNPLIENEFQIGEIKKMNYFELACLQIESNNVSEGINYFDLAIELWPDLEFAYWEKGIKK